MSRPPDANERLSVSEFDGQVCYRLKNKWRDGSEMVVFSPTEFLEKLVALIPQPRIHQVRYHGVLAPHSAIRSKVVPTPPLKGERAEVASNNPASKRKRMTWAQLLKRVFNIDIETCSCGGKLKVIAAIIERKVVVKILEHLNLPTEPPAIALPRAPPPNGLGSRFFITHHRSADPKRETQGIPLIVTGTNQKQKINDCRRFPRG